MTTLEYYPKIIFEGNEYILVDGSAIGTKESFENGTISYAHLCPSGEIKRFHKVIGTKDDIIFTGEFIEATPDFGDFMEGILGDTWIRNDETDNEDFDLLSYITTGKN